jgi:acyl-CoA synthetase (AMP-forming)/AMP-acid ligase II
MEFNLALVNETVVSAVPDRELFVWRDRRLTYGQIGERSRRLATYLNDHGLGVRQERAALATHESGQDHVALYLYNGNEYLEGMLGCFKSRTVPINVNYRYVDDELRYLFQNSRSTAVIYHAVFAPRVAAVRDLLPRDSVLLQVADDSDNPLLPGAVDYEEALAASAPDLPDLPFSPDDLYALYTGGTTGMPKGVLWRQNDIYMNAMGGRMPGVWESVTSYDDIRERAQNPNPVTMLLIPPMMHGSAQWASFNMMSNGGRLVVPDDNTHMDCVDILRVVEREKVNAVAVVGDAVARPLIAEMETGKYDLSSLLVIGNGSAPLSPAIKERILDLLPNVLINDGVGSSETGAQGSHVSTKGAVATGTFTPGPGSTVVSDDFTRVLEPGHDGIGWFAQSGWVPLGYLGDPEKSARTFPVINGVRYAVPGDRARLLSNGVIEVLGRDAVTINTGGEKVFAEEVEAAISSHPAVQDVTVCGRSSERWGTEVVAVVQLASPESEQELELHAGKVLARYKLPKGWVFVDKVMRSPSGKADYRWARDVAEAARASAAN